MFKRFILILFLLLGNNWVFAEDSKENNVTVKSVKKKKTLSEKKLVIFVTNGDLQIAGMGFGIALSGVKQGADVTIVIGANALKYAFKEGEQNIYFAKERTPRALLEAAIKAGAEVQLCSANTEEMGFDEDDFIKGVKIVISTEIFSKVYEKEVKIISF